MSKRKPPDPQQPAVSAAPRQPNGRLLPGCNLNPGGRPKVWREFQAAMRERSPVAVAKVDEALKSDDPGVYTWAVDKVLGYAWGRPPQRLQVGGDEDAPPVRHEGKIDWAKYPPEMLAVLLEAVDALDSDQVAVPPVGAD